MEENKNVSFNTQKQGISIDFKALFMEVLDKGLVIIFLTIICGAATYLACSTVLPLSYESTTKIYIMPQEDAGQSSYKNLEIGSLLTTDYLEMVQGRTVVEKTITHFGLDTTYEKFLKKLKVENPIDTRIIQISIKDKDPALARNMAAYLRDSSIETISTQMGIEGISVWEEANLPEKPNWTALECAIIVAILVAFLVVCFVIARYIIIDKVISADDIENRLNIPVLGAISYENYGKTVGKKAGKKSDALGDQKMISLKERWTVSSRNKENYKSLRANIEFCTDSPKVILVTSSIPGEGKSISSLMMAFEIAKSGKKVLFLDMDMRKSKWAELLGIKKEDRKGISDCLIGKVGASDIIWKTDVENLYVILSGSVPPNPSELLGQKRFEQFLNGCKNTFDYVIIDAPPLTNVIDAAVICGKCDGVLYVIASDMVSCRVVKRALQQIERANGRILGVVLNKIKLSNRALYGTYGTNKYYYSNYDKYYK